MRLLTVFALIAVLVPCYAAEVATLNACDSLEDFRIDLGKDWEHSDLEVVTDPGFAVEGDGAVRIHGTSPADRDGNSYLSVRVAIPTTDFDAKALSFDAATSTPDESEALYVRGFDADGNAVLSWTSWNGQLEAGKKTWTLHPGLSDQGLAWESSYIESDDRSAVASLVFIVGTHNAGADFDMVLDNIRIEPSTKKTFTDVTEPKPLYPETTLVEDGDARAIIVAPQDDEWAAFAAEVAGAVEQATGVALPVVAGDEVTDEDLAATNAIVVGSIVNNRALLYPYSHQLTFADGVYPGDGGYEVRTVPDPWGTGRNLIAIGASDIPGARAGLEALRPHLAEGETLVLPSILEVELAGGALESYGHLFTETLDDDWAEKIREECETHLVRAGTRGLFSRAQTQGRNYALTGREEYARMYVWMIKRTYENYLSDPDTYGGPWGMDSDFHIYHNIPAWDAVEESPVVTDEERLEITKILFRWVSELGPGKSASPTSKRVRFNHQTFPALGCLYAGQYFSRYYDAVEGENWIDIADGTFQFQLDASKAHCDCNTYQWLTLNHTMIYAMARPDLRYFENGNARLNADYAVMTMNNLGYQVPYGDIGGWGPLGTELRILRMAEWYYRDGRYQWAIDRKMQVRPRVNLSSFSLGDHHAVKPDHLLGTKGWAVDEKWYDSFSGEEHVALERAVDKISFRDSYEPDADYLLLDGLTLGGHGHMDGNAILQWTADERIWLADADYIKSLPKYHNSMLVIRDGQSAPVPAYAELENLADLETLGASQTVARDYAGVDWHRNVIWIKPDVFVVADRMVANEPGDYSFRAVWQTIGETELDGSRLSVEQEGRFATIAMTPDTQCILNEDAATGSNWGSYPYIAEPLVKSMQGIVNAELEAGEEAVLFTVMHASGEEPADLRLLRLSDNSAAITGLGDPVLVAVRDEAGTIEVPGAGTIDGQMAVVTPTHISALGATAVRTADDTRQFAEPTDLEADLAAGSATLRSPAVNSIGIEQSVATEQFGGGISRHEIEALINILIASAPPVEGGAADAMDVPEMTGRWAYMERPDNFLLTGNPGEPASVNAVADVSATPDPLEANVFSGEAGRNTLGNIFDGRDDGTSDATMWEDDQEVTIDLDLLDSYHIEQLNLSAWFATSSSKGNTFQLGRIQVLASDDGFADDERTLVDFTDEEMHPNWGLPIHQPMEYDFELDANARNLRVILTPRPGSAVYVAELQAWGTGDGLEELAASQATGGEAAYTFNSVHSADLDGDGAPEVIGGNSNGHVYCLDADGEVRWSHDCGVEVNSVTTVDFSGEDRPTVVAGTMNGFVVALNADGEHLWTYEVPYYKRTPHVRTVFSADLAGDGSDAVIAGADSWRYYAIDAQGNELWHYESVHGSTAGAAADVDGDGRDEVIAGTEYYRWHVVNPDGTRRFRVRTVSGPCANAVAAGDLDGDGRHAAIFGGADSTVQAVSPDGDRLWTVNTGDEVTDLACVDVDGDGADEVLASSLSFNVYCIEGDGTIAWRTALPNQVTTIAVSAGEPLRLAAGCDDGAVYALDVSDGSIIGRFETGGRLIDIAPAGPGEIVASSRDGYVHAISLP
ncbi:MAG: PQQ-binding-like beta-propeller repeat protein [Armatimonadota bacterium]